MTLVPFLMPFCAASVPARARRAAPWGPGDDEETPIGDPPDDDGDDWDGEDEDEDEEDEDPLQAAGILQRSIATSDASRHNGDRLTG